MEELPDDFSVDLINNLENGNWRDVVECLGEIREMSREIMGQAERAQKLLKGVTYILSRIKYLVSHDVDDDKEDIWKVTAECFRVLRTFCVNGDDVQLFIANETHAVGNTVIILESILQENCAQESAVVCARCGTQFLGNLVTQNYETGQMVWDLGQDLIKSLLSADDRKIASYGSVVMLNIISQVPNVKSEVTEEMVGDLLKLVDFDCEFGLFCIEELLGSKDFLVKMYGDESDSTKRRQILEIALTALKQASYSQSSNSQALENMCVHVSNIDFIVQWFISKSDAILKTCDSDLDTMDAGEVSIALEVLTAATSLRVYKEYLQMNKNLVVEVVYLLKAMHLLGKSENNFFSKVEKLSESLLKGGSNEVSRHPAFGFKANLVRIIGNMCWRNRENQNVVLEYEIVPVILDCCSLDARNPFISQCSIFTLKSLCEDNPEIQNVIAGMKLEGKADSEVLAQFGLELRDIGGKVVVTRK